MTLVLPWPDPRLLPNRKLHWAIKGAATREARANAGWLAKAMGCDPIRGDCSATVTFYPPDKRRRDLQDSLLRTLKPVWDGIVDSGLLRDDSQIRSITAQMGEPDKRNPRVEITIKDVE